MKNFCSSKGIIKGVIKQDMDSKNILAVHTSKKGLIYRIYE